MYFEGRGGEETLYIENLNRFQKSGFTKQFTVFSPVGNVSLVSWVPYRGSGSFHKGGWGICIVRRNLNSIFCSVTFQSAYLERPCIESSFLFCFYSQASFKKKKKMNKPSCTFSESSSGLFVNIARETPFLSWSHLRQSVWTRKPAWFDLFWWLLLDLTLPTGMPSTLLPLSSLEKSLGPGGYLLVCKVSESAFRRSVSFMKFTPKLFQVLWPFLSLGAIMPFNCPAQVWHLFTFYGDESQWQRQRPTGIVGVRQTWLDGLRLPLTSSLNLGSSLITTGLRGLIYNWKIIVPPSSGFGED